LLQNELHELLVGHRQSIIQWFSEKRKDLVLPFYTSVDIRDSSKKVVSVDANLYPAGFNNICPADMENIPSIIRQYIEAHYSQDLRKIALLTEEHTSNLYYWDNVYALSNSIQEAGYEVRVAIPKVFKGNANIKSASGRTITVYPSQKNQNHLLVGEDFEPELVISNNDFSQSYEDWGQGLETPINPAREMGWYQRKKSSHFKFYNQVASEFAGVLGVDPWTFQVRTEKVSELNLDDSSEVERLAESVGKLLETIAEDYRARQIDEAPVVFIKNNSGTYGLGVIPVSSPKDVIEWNSKTKKQMKVSKGKKTVNDLILQEGVRSDLRTDVGSAEPTIYMIGCELIGGFLRTHAEKGPQESLNSPGAVFKKLCVSDLKVKPEGSPMENVYGWVARLSSLAIGLEIQEMGVQFKGFKKTAPGC